MAQLSVTWSKFTVHKKHDIDRDAPYLWVFGILVDVNTIKSKDYVITRPCVPGNLGQRKFKKGEHVAVAPSLDIVKTVNPLFGFVSAGVVVVAWENAMTTDATTTKAYNAARDAINDFVADRVANLDLDAPTQAEIDKLSDQIQDDVRATIKENWSIFQLIHDHYIGSANCIPSIDGDLSLPIDFRFKTGSTDYELNGEFKYTG